MSAAANGNGNNGMGMGNIREALENIANNNNNRKNNRSTRKATKKLKKLQNRKSLKARKFKSSQNRQKELMAERRKKKNKVMRERRMKAIRISEYGEAGLEKLERKLKRLNKLYDAASVEQQNNMTMYMLFLTEQLQTMFQRDFQEELFGEYPELFDEDIAKNHPYEYLEELKELVEDLLEQYDSDDLSDHELIALDIQAQSILDVVLAAGNDFNSIDQARRNESINALINIFGTFGI